MIERRGIVRALQESLLQEGNELKDRIDSFLSSLPHEDSDDELGARILEGARSEREEEASREIAAAVQRWFNQIHVDVLPYVLEDRPNLQARMWSLLRSLRGDWRSQPVYMVEVLYDAGVDMDWALEIIQRAPVATDLQQGAGMPMASVQQTYRPNTAFIIMWMNPTIADLEDVVNAYKETCGRYGITAVRADDIEHQDVITEVILEHIRYSEFLIGDLTGERPNVYYEIGYAHAHGKRPILYRRKGTPLHFDLSVHNVPEYANITQLRGMLEKRLEAMTGRQPG